MQTVPIECYENSSQFSHEVWLLVVPSFSLSEAVSGAELQISGAVWEKLEKLRASLPRTAEVAQFEVCSAFLHRAGGEAGWWELINLSSWFAFQNKF